MAQRRKRKKAARRAIRGSPLLKGHEEQIFGRAYQHLCALPASGERNVRRDRAVCAYLLLLFHKRYREEGIGQRVYCWSGPQRYGPSRPATMVRPVAAGPKTRIWGRRGKPGRIESRSLDHSRSC